MDKIALITGASRGIGAEIARTLAKNSYKVIINYLHSKDAALALAKEVDGVAIQADISDPNDVKKMFNTITSEIGHISVLINNAGIAKSGLITDFSDEEWQKMFSVNVDGMFYCCREAIPYMIHEKYGNIINISSIWGIAGASCEVPYSASKAAVIGFTKALAKELGPSGIRVNCIAPGVIDTDMNSALSQDDMDSLKNDTPLGIIGSPKDVADTAFFLVSDSAKFITGQVFGVNGGFLI